MDEAADDKRYSSYHKKQILATLKKINCSPNKNHELVSRLPTIEAKGNCWLEFLFFFSWWFPIQQSVCLVKCQFSEFIDTRAKLCQAKIDETMKSNVQYANLSRCVDDLCESGASHLTDNTLSATVEAIANLERIPEPSAINGIDLKRLYKLLGNLMAGYPIEDLEEGATKDFLRTCYEVNNSAVFPDLVYPNIVYGSFSNGIFIGFTFRILWRTPMQWTSTRWSSIWMSKTNIRIPFIHGYAIAITINIHHKCSKVPINKSDIYYLPYRLLNGHAFGYWVKCVRVCVQIFDATTKRRIEWDSRNRNKKDQQQTGTIYYLIQKCQNSVLSAV